MNGFGKVAVLMGGRSAEREVSLRSGSLVLAALLRKGVDAHAFDPAERAVDALVQERFARAFIALHGRFGEDGTMQGALELLGIPYTGSGVMASALAMDKWRTKLVWQSCGVATPRCELLHADSDFAAVADRLGLPIMVKPANEGSSIGMSKVRSAAVLADAYALAARYDALIIAEQFIEGVELTAGILGRDTLPLIRLETPRDFYDYDAKYVANDTRYIIPCGLPAAAEATIRGEALRAFDALGCRGWGRVDAMLDRTGKPHFLEVNTSPGMTDHSLVPMAARHAGLSYDELCLRILEGAALQAGGGAHVG
ncbi:MAG: D-alanine--D-alanine ligase [Betaproteobacteria bacterium]|nr:D-alanine--D-alanine ligase [Betaproteobacteria bacterium]